MGWVTCLPTVCMSKTSISFSHKSAHLFEEMPFSECSFHSISALEFSNLRDETSSEKVCSFMCDYCDYNSDSKLNVFEHFIKNHVFLCTLCSYVGFSRSDVLRHCLESHEKNMKQKLKSIKTYKLNADKLCSELCISSHGFKNAHQPSGTNQWVYDSDGSSDEEMSKSSFLSKSNSRSKNSLGPASSDKFSDVEDEMEKFIHPKRKFRPISHYANKKSKTDSADSYHHKDYDHGGAKTSENMDHFLDEMATPGIPTHAEENEFSDSSQIDLFFSAEGNENDPDLGESIFHDHKEMFMITRLPFPIRQDDSPNDPYHDSTPQSEPPSILQSILQEEKQEPEDSPSSFGTNVFSEKVCLSTNLPESSSCPGLSVPSGETLQKQMEAVIPISSPFTNDNTRSHDASNLKTSENVTEDFLKSPETIVNSNTALASSASDDSFNKSSTQSGQGGQHLMDNFLLSPSNVKKEVEIPDKVHDNLKVQCEKADKLHIENEKDDNLRVQNEKVDKLKIPNEKADKQKEKSGLLFNLLKEKQKPDGQQTIEKSLTLKSASVLTSKSPISMKNASDMSLMELLSLDTPFSLHVKRPTPGVKKDNLKKSNHGVRTSISFACTLCNQTFSDKITLDSHVSSCIVRNPLPGVRSKPSNGRLVESSMNKHHASVSDPGQSSLRTGNFTASKMISTFSENFMKTSLNAKASQRTHNLLKSNKRYSGEPVSRYGLKHRKPRKTFSIKSQSKHGNRLRDHAKTLAAVNDSSVLRRMKQKAEQNDYDPESERSESSDDSSTESFKQKKKARRVRKYLLSSARKQQPKSSTSSAMSELCDKALSNEEINTGSQDALLSPTSLSSSLSSSWFSSSISSSLSSSLSLASPIVTEIERGKQEKMLASSTSSRQPMTDNDFLKEGYAKGSHELLKAALCSPSSKLDLMEFRKSPVDQAKVNELKIASTKQTASDKIAVSGPTDHYRDPSQTMLHRLLNLPSGSINTQQYRANTVSHSSTNSMAKLKTGSGDDLVKKQRTANLSSVGIGDRFAANCARAKNDEPLPKHSFMETSLDERQQQFVSPLDSIAGGQNVNRSRKLLRNRSYSVTESDIVSDKSVAKTLSPIQPTRQIMKSMPSAVTAPTPGLISHLLNGPSFPETSKSVPTTTSSSEASTSYTSVLRNLLTKHSRDSNFK